MPRIPRDAVEADAMLQTLTVLTDITKAPGWIREYAGCTMQRCCAANPFAVDNFQQASCGPD